MSSKIIHTGNQQKLHKDNLKQATKHTRQIKILLYVQKYKHPSKRLFFTVLCNFFLQSLIHSCSPPYISLRITYYFYKPVPYRLVPPPFPILHITSPHSTSLYFHRFTSLYCTSLHSTLDTFSLNFRLFTSLYAASLQFSISSTLYFLSIQPNYFFPYPPFKSEWFAGENS